MNTKAIEIAKKVLNEKSNPLKVKKTSSIKGLKFFLGNFDNAKLYCEEVCNDNKCSKQKSKG